MSASELRAIARSKLQGKWGKLIAIQFAYMVIAFVLGFIQGIFKEVSTIQSLMSLVVAVIEIPLSFGLIISYVRFYNNEDVKPFDFLSQGFSNFSKSWGITLNIICKLILPIILLVVAIVLFSYGIASSSIALLAGATAQAGSGMGFFVVGIILYIASLIWLLMQSYYYQLAMIIVAEDNSLTSKEYVAKSKEMMTGKRGKLFCLQLSFIGWFAIIFVVSLVGSLIFKDTAYTIFTLIVELIASLFLVPYVQLAIIAFYYSLTGKSTDTNAVTDEDVIKNN